MLVGYARVSKADDSQKLDLQMDALSSEGVEIRAIYQDKASGKKEERPGLQSCLKGKRPINPTFPETFLA